MELLREWQLEQVVPMGALMDWVEDEAVHLELALVEARPPVDPVVQHLQLVPDEARAAVGPVLEAVVAEEPPQQR
jgi:hypothetical protein